MKKAETALREWTLNRVHFDGGKDIKIWPVEPFRVLTQSFRALDGTRLIEVSYGNQPFMKAKMTALVDWFQVKCAHKILEELNLFHLLTPLWLAQCGSWAGVAKMTRPYRKAEAKRITEADWR